MGGKAGGIEVTKYGMTQHFGVCAQADVLLSITIKEKVAWTGVVDTQRSFVVSNEQLFGGVEKEGGVEGVVYWLPGGSTQVVDDLIAQKFGRANGADCPGFRGIATAVFTGPAGTPHSGFDWSKKVGGKKGFYWSANIPYLPGVWITVRRAPVGLDPAIALVPRIGVDFFPYFNDAAGGFPLAGVRFTPDGRTFVVVGGGSYQVWDAMGHVLVGTYAADVGTFALADGGMYALRSFFGQTLQFVPLGSTTGTVIVANVDFPQTMGRVFYVNGFVFTTAALGGNGYRNDGDHFTHVGAIDWFFTGPNLETWGVADVGGSLEFTVVDTGHTFTVLSPTTGEPFATLNGDGEILVWQNGTLILVDPVGETVLDSQAGVPADGPDDAFINARSGEQTIWLDNTEYDTHTLQVIRSIVLDDWAPAGTIQNTIYSWADHALISKPLFADEFQFRQLDRGGHDANPAHIIYETLTNTDWGMGTSPAAIDFTSFSDAAITLAGESLGLSLIWTRQASIQDFCQEILDHIQGVIFVDPATGLLTLKLIRADYNPATLETIDETNATLSSFSRKIWGDIANEIAVSWTNPTTEQEETVTIQDLASIAAQGGIVSDSRNYYGVRTSIMAGRLAQRELRSSGAPLAGCEAQVSRKFWQARPASVYKVNWTEHGLSGVVMRVTDVDYGMPGDSTITLTLLEDVYGLDIGQYVTPPSSLWTDPSLPPAAMEFSEVVTIPTYMLLDAGVDASAAVYPEVMAGVLASTSNIDTLTYELWGEVTDSLGNVSWEMLAERNVLGRATLTGALVPEALTTGVSFSGLIGAVAPTKGGFAIIGGNGESGNEIALITVAGATYTLGRGALDTVPRDWPAGTPVYFIADDTLLDDPTTRAAGETVRYRLLTRTSLGLLPLAQAPVLSYTLTDRPWLPSRPANLDIGGTQFNDHANPVDLTARVNPWVTVTWANRNRLLEDGQVLAWTDGDVTPETGQTATIYVYAEDGTTLLDTIPGLTGTTHDIPDASFAGEAIALVVVGATRTDADGTFDSLQNHGIWVQLAPVAAGALGASGVGGFTGASALVLGSSLSGSGVGAAPLVGEEASAPAGGDLRTPVGNGNRAAGGGAGNSGLAQLIKITTPAGVSSTIASVQAGFSGFGTQTLKPLIYADSAGEPTGTPLAVGPAHTPGSTGTSPFYTTIPFTAPVTLSAATDYWIGYVPSTTVSVIDSGTFPGNAAGRSQSINHASPGNWDNTTDSVTTETTIWAVLEQAGAATGLHHQGHTEMLGSTGSMLIMLPPYAVGDTIVLHSSQNFGTAPTISGFSAFASNGYAGGTHILLERTVDGTEDGTANVPAPSGNNRTFVATVFRGGGTREGTATSASSGTSPTSPAVTVTNAPGRVYNFLLSGEGGSGASNAGSADAWTDVYAFGTTLGNDFTMSLSYQDRASAGSAGTETRTISNGFYQWTCFAIPDA